MFRPLTTAASLLVLTLAARGEDRKELAGAERELLEWVNKVRAEHKLPALKANATLARVAREHSADMARQEKMSHVLDDKNPAQRIREAGYAYARIGENIAMSEGLQREVVQKGWMDSRPHRENILNERFREIGIGIARNDKGEYYYTQVFGTPRKR